MNSCKNVHSLDILFDVKNIFKVIKDYYVSTLNTLKD